MEQSEWRWCSAETKLSFDLKPDAWLKHFFVYGFGVILMNAISFLFIPLYTRLIPATDFGVLELFNRSQEFLLLMMSFGFRATVLTLYQMEEGPKERRAIYSTAIHFLFFTGLLITAAAWQGVNGISRSLFGAADRAYEVRIMLAATFAESMFQMAALFLQSSLRSVLYMGVFISRAIFSVFLNIWMVYYLRWGLKGVLLATLLHTGIYAVGLCLYVLYEAGLRFDKNKLKAMLKFGLPLVPGAVAMFFLNNGDRYFLNIYSSKADIGVYGLAYKLGTLILTIILYPFGKIWSVTMVDMGKGPEGPKSLGAVGTYLLLVSAFFTLALSLLSPYVLHVVTTPAYWGAAKLIPVIAAAYVFYTFATVIDASFYLTKRTMSKPVILSLSFVLVFGLYRWLIPIHGVMGAAWATLGGFIGYALIAFVFAQRTYRIEYEIKRLAGIVLLGTALLVGGGFINANTGFQGLFWRCLLIAAFPAILFSVPFFHAHEIVTMRNGLRALWSLGNRRGASRGVETISP